MLALRLRTANERTLFVISAAFSAVIWLVLTITVVGILYGLLILAFVLIAHAMYLAYVTMNGVKVTKNQFPELYHKIQRASTLLGMATTPDAYVMQAGGILNAFATKLFSRTFIILYSDLLDACEDASGSDALQQLSELDFIIGHELGHLAAGHLSWQGFLAPARLLPWLGPAYSRACEYTCDACGSAVVRSLEVASRSLAILAAGGRYGKRVDLAEFTAQRAESGRFWAAVYELNSSHPFLPKRIAALHEAAQPGSMPKIGRSFFAWILAPLFGFGAGSAGGGGILVIVMVMGILAAIAIPNFVAMQLRSKRSELPANLDALRMAELAYAQSHNGAFLACGSEEAARSEVSKESRPWIMDSASACFSELGWQPDGAVYGAYWVVIGYDEKGQNTFEGWAVSDIDGDGDLASFMATPASKAIMTSAVSAY